MGRRPGLKPHLWSTGPDPVTHEKFMKWHQQRNQAHWRGEKWAIEFDKFCELWGDQWDRRGRKPDDLCMVRKNYDEDWTLENVHIISRNDHWQHQHHHRRVQKQQAIGKQLD